MTGPTRAGMDVADVIERAAQVLVVNGRCRRYLYDTRQAVGGTPLADCRVDVIGALNVAAHGTPRYAASPAVYAAEQALLARLGVVSLIAWNDEQGRTDDDIIQALRDTATDLRAEVTA